MAKHTRNSSRSDGVVVEVKSKVSGSMCLIPGVSSRESSGRRLQRWKSRGGGPTSGEVLPVFGVIQTVHSTPYLLSMKFFLVTLVFLQVERVACFASVTD